MRRGAEQANTGTVWTSGGKAKACGKAMLVLVEDERRAVERALISAINAADPNDVRSMRSGRADIARPPAVAGARWRKTRFKSVHQAASSVLLVECALREVERRVGLESGSSALYSEKWGQPTWQGGCNGVRAAETEDGPRKSR